MKLTHEGIRDKEKWNKIGITLPEYDIEKVRRKALEAPRWVHFGIGNIFRVFIGGIADDLISRGYLDRGITCVETFDYEVVDNIYLPYDNLALSVILHEDGTRSTRVLGSMAEAIKAQYTCADSWNRLKEVFKSRELQLVSITITEKGYLLRKADGTYFDFAQADIDNGPERATSAMAVLTAMLFIRYQDSKAPIALVSMDNCSQNGSLLKSAVSTIAVEWERRGYVDDDFLLYVQDEEQVSFPWTMIDKITPRPSELIAQDLEAVGLEDMCPIVTSKKTYIAPFVNAEKEQYLVIEDSFPNKRPALEKAFGTYLTDRDTVNLSERMKVTACLNPVHSALGPLGVLLGIDHFTDVLENPEMLKMGRQVAYGEGLPVILDPKIISPQAFLDELFERRFPNKHLGDTNMRLSTDVSQGLGVRFGETIKAYVEKYGTADRLVAIPLGIAGWLRYLLGVDDGGNIYHLAPDPISQELTVQLRDIVVGNPASLKHQLKPILSNENIFLVNLYSAGIGDKIEEMFREMIMGAGAVRKSIHKWCKEMVVINC